jgi:putative ABC transport system permease protein
MAWLRRLLNTVRSRRLSGDLDREIAFHLAERTDELEATGLSRAEAARQARRQFGNPTVHRDDTRDVDLLDWLYSILRDVRYSIRGLRRSPTFTAVAIGSLGLGIGVNTAIFALIDAVVLRTLPVKNAEELWQIQGAFGGENPYLTNPLWEQIRDRQSVFGSVAAFGSTGFNLAETGVARVVAGDYVNGAFFETFAVPPAIGRLFSPGDDVRGCAGSAVLSYRFWQLEYGGARDVVGRTINLTGHPFEIIGVAGETFRGPVVGREPAVYAPLCTEAIVRGSASSLDHRSNWFLRAIGRLSPGSTAAQVNHHLLAISQAIFAETVPTHWGAAEQREYLGRTLHGSPLSRGFSGLRDSYGTALFALMAGVGLVLLIACANVANLLMSRAESRQRELAIRLALGAGRGRLARQFFTESLILAAAGTGVGLIIAGWAGPALVGMLDSGERAAISLDLALNSRVLGFTIAVAALTVVGFGLLPAGRAARVDAQLTMKATGRIQGLRPARVPFGKALVAGQVALSLLLVVGAGLFIGTLRRLSQVEAGFDPGGILLVDVDLRRAGLSPEALGPTERILLDRIRSLPGVTRAASVDISPVSGSSWNDQILMDGLRLEGEAALSFFNRVSEGYFEAMRTRLLAGRDFDRTDQPGAPEVAIVNDAWSRRFVGDGSPLGRQFRVRVGDSASAPMTVIGVVENAKYQTLREAAEPTVFLARPQATPGSPTLTFTVRTGGDPNSLRSLLTPAITSVRSGIFLEYRTLSDQLAGSLRRERMLAVLSALFGALALVLAMLGLYGVMTYAVTRRRGELGVRIALGAAPGSVIRMILGEVAVVVAVGLAVGAVAAIGVTRLVTSLLYSIEPGEPAVYLSAAAILAAVALGAGLIPAWRAARVDPLEALREQ